MWRIILWGPGGFPLRFIGFVTIARFEMYFHEVPVKRQFREIGEIEGGNFEDVVREIFLEVCGKF